MTMETLHKRGGMKATAGSMAACMIVVLAWFSPWWIGGKNLLPMDLAHEMMQPWRGGGEAGVAKNHFVADVVDVVMCYHLFANESYRREGRVGWNNLIYGGTAQYADTMALHDDWTLQLQRWFDFTTGWHLGLMGQVLLAAWGMVALLRAKGVGALWSGCAALAYAANSQFSAWIYHRFTLGAFCWVPWILWAVVCYRRGSRAAWCAVPVFIALAFLGGTLQQAAIVALAVAAAWAEEAWTGWRGGSGIPHQAKLLGRFAAWGLLASGLAGLMLLPCIDALAASMRLGLHTGMFSGAEKSVYPEGPLQPLFNLAAYPLMAFPSVLGRCNSVDVLKLFKSNLFFVAYFGSLPVLVSWYAAVRKDTGMMERLLILIGLALPLTPAVRYLYQRLLILFILGGVIAFAVFMQRSGDEMRRRIAKWGAWVAAAVSAIWLVASAALALFGGGFVASLQKRITSEGAGSSFGGCKAWLEARAVNFTGDLYIWSGQHLLPLLLLGLGLWGLAWTASALDSRRRLGSWLLAFAVVAEVTLLASRWVVWTDPARYPVFPETPEVTALKQHVGRTGRVTTLIHPTEHMSRTPFIPNTLSPYGIAVIGGYGSIVPNGMILPNEDTGNAARLGRLGVSHLVTWHGNPDVRPEWTPVWSSPSMDLYQNTLALPRYVGFASEVEKESLFSERKPRFTPLEETGGLQNRREIKVPPGIRWVRIAENHADGWEYRNVSSNRWLPVQRAEDASMLLENPDPGAEMKLEMRYDPPLRKWGLLVSGISFIVTLVIACFLFRNPRLRIRPA